MENIPSLNKSIPVVKTNSLSVEKIAHFILGATLILLPVFLIPSKAYTLETAKIILIVVGVVGAMFMFLLGSARSGKFEFPRTKLMWGVLLVPVVFLISALLSSNPEMSLFGYSLESGSWAFVTLGFSILFLTTILFKDREKIFYSYVGLFGAVILVILYSLGKIFFGAEFLSFGLLSGITANLVGNWTDLAAFLAMGAILTVVALESIPLDKGLKTALGIVLAVSLFLLAILNFSTVWLLLLIFSLIYFVYIASLQVANSEGQHERRISFSALLLLIVSLLFYFNPSIGSTGKVGSIVATKFGVNNAEVRPSYLATGEIIRSTLGEKLFLGSGPNTFETQWLMHKPAGVNESDFWNVSFPSGFGLLPTFVVTSGILGTLAWLLFLVFYIQLGIKSLFSEISDPLYKFLTTSSFLVSLFFWILNILYVPGTVIFTLTFFFTGLFIASAVSSGVIQNKVIAFGHNARLSFISILVLIALLLGNVVFAYSSLSRVVSTKYFQSAVHLANDTNDPNKVIAELNKAIGLAAYDTYYRSLSQVYIAQANQAINSTELADADKAQAFQEALRSSITAAQSAVDANPGNYQNWIMLGRIYESLVPKPIAIEGSYESAKNAYQEALKRNPNSPEIYLLLARLEVVHGDNGAARTYINQSLAQKNNYADAYFLLTQIEIAENKISEAISATEKVAVLSPNNAGVFFQLGLLKYNAKDYQGAAEALAYAINLVPDYANARYFLGLSLDELGNKDQALAQFEELAKTNPDNSEIQTILENLRKGKKALTSIPSSETNVGTRSTPPISDQAR